MADRGDVDWTTCTEDGCIGIPLPAGGKCWAHADSKHVDAALQQVSKLGWLDARGVPISAELLTRLVNAVASGRDYGRPVLRNVLFARAIFLGDADFHFKTFEGIAAFHAATFKGRANFRNTKFGHVEGFEYSSTDTASFLGAVFEGNADFRDATFERKANFRWAEFRRFADLRNVIFQSQADFNSATFQEEAWFRSATFQATAGFSSAIFKRGALFSSAAFHDMTSVNYATFEGGGASFSEVTFKADAFFTHTVFASAGFEGAKFWTYAVFTGATFERGAWFEGATFHGDAWFRAARFEQVRELGPLLARKALVLDHAVFRACVAISASAAACCCRHALFTGGAQLRLRWAQIVLDDADLAAPSLLTGVPAFPNLDEGRWAQALARLNRRLGDGNRGSRPRLISLRRANVAGLTVANADLQACRFAGAHHLDQILFEECTFATAPKKWRWTARQTIAEEHQWRADRALARMAGGKRSKTAEAATGTAPGEAFSSLRWYSCTHQPPAWVDVDPLTPGQLTALYRALRKGREDNKDEPGAADFYYGEMEMRRHDPVKPNAERLVLFLYWLFSGYALRASRALTWLLAVLVTATFVLAELGLHRSPANADWPLPTRLGTAALVAVEGAVFRTSEQQLTYAGQLVQDLLRIAGPVLLGLAVLSIRGRVKR